MPTNTSAKTEATSAPSDVQAGEEVTHLVTISPDEVVFRIRDGETIVEGLRRQGMRTRYKCRRGGCAECRATLLCGEVAYPSGVALDVVDGPVDRVAGGGIDKHVDADEGYRGSRSAGPNAVRCLPCRAVPRSDVHLLLGPTDQVVNVFGALMSRTAQPPAAEGPTSGSHEGSSPCPS